MLYWVTGAINSSFWPYYTARHGDWVPSGGPPIAIPTAYLGLPREIVRPPRSLAEPIFTNIQRWTEVDRGGHFAAWEEPATVAADLRAFFHDRRV